MVRPKTGERISKIDTYLNCAEVFAYRGITLIAGIILAVFDFSNKYYQITEVLFYQVELHLEIMFVDNN